MLAIPLKATCRIDLTRPLRSFVKREFAEQHGEDSEVEQGLRDLQAMRDGAVSARSATSEGTNALGQYYAQSSFAQSRFPVSNTQIKLSFTWYDAFQPRSRKAVACSWALEQAAMLYKLAAIESHAGNARPPH